MARTKSWNPIAFLPTQTTIIVSAAYIALLVALLYTHLTVPPAPTSPAPAAGINLTQAWRDLQYLSDGFHPWGSRRHDVVSKYLLERVGEILEHNEVDYQTVYAGDHGFHARKASTSKPTVTVFANDTSNFTAIDNWTGNPWTLYGESMNILVYIRGTEDTASDWWNDTTPMTRYEGQSGVLVSAHYDSVSSGYGATDDGVGIVSILQLISHFTTQGNRPRRGLVALLNSAEENGLYGAHNYVRHPLSSFPHTFLNLEGAGAGGRAMLFRATDAEVASHYRRSPYPFGSVVSGDGFKRGFIRSGTDYTVFTDELGLRGLDVAFFEPRARYHTNQDDSRNTSPNSVWHMLSASLATVRSLTSYKGDEFEGEPTSTGKLTGCGSVGVWFDLFGRVFAVAQLNTFFALSVTLLVAGPILLILLEVVIRRQDKWYPFAGKRYLHSQDDDNAVRIHGRRGLFRFVVAFVIATAVVIALALLVTKINPYIAYSSEYSVWAMMLCAWFAVAWFFCAGAAEVRPTALHRFYVLLWIYILTWVFLVLATVGEKNMQIASGYFLVVYNASAFVALLISYLEFFALPTMAKYVDHVLGAQVDSHSIRPGSQSSRRLLDQSENDESDPTETTSLLRGRTSRTKDQHTFAGLSRRRPDRDQVPEDSKDPYLAKAFEDEQAWSSSLPSWTWLLQFLVLAPINIIIVGQITLMLVSATHQTPADGNPVLPVYLGMAVFTVLLLLPLAPFLHRVRYYVPTFLFLAFVGCLIYNLVAFPFSRDARLKYYFVQHMDLNNGNNTVAVMGVDGFVQDIVAEMPSADGQTVNCGTAPPGLNRQGLVSCTWEGIQPSVVPPRYPGLPANLTRKPTFKDWLRVNTTAHGSSALITLQGLNTKMCRIEFEHPVSGLQIEGGATDPRQPTVPRNGSTEVRLFSRSWDKTFRLNATWSDGAAKGQKGKAWCMWVEESSSAPTIPAFHEQRRFAPVWSVVTKASNGLLEGYKEFEI